MSGIITESCIITTVDENNNINYKTLSGVENITTFPCVVGMSNSTNPITIYFSNDILVSSITNDTTLNPAYFICDQDNITFDGKTKNSSGTTNITISNVVQYTGFIQNGSANSNAYTNIKINNINIDSVNSNFATDIENTIYGCGWLCSAFFGYYRINNELYTYITNNCIIDYCSSNGSIIQTNAGGANGSGGLLGVYSIAKVINCFSTGTIGTLCGGIIGMSATNSLIENCYSTGSIASAGGGITSACINTVIKNCYSSGIIDNGGAGGIASQMSNSSFEYFHIENCYSTGDIGNSSGGILGQYSSANIKNCYSRGNISIYAGGIVGASFGFQISNSTLYIENCYSLGNITNGGGIVGGNSLYQSIDSSIQINNCYNTGTINEGGGIIGIDACIDSINSTITVNNCYVCNKNNYEGAIYADNSNINSSTSPLLGYNNTITFGDWNDTDAITLINSSNYASIEINTPYILLNFNKNFYNGITTTSVSVSQNTKLPISIFGNFFTMITDLSNININTTTGQLTSNTPGNFVLNYITHGIKDGNYIYGYNTISNFNLIVYMTSPKIFEYENNFISKKNKKKTSRRIKKIIDDLN